MTLRFREKHKEKNKHKKVYDIQNSYPSDPRTIFIKEIQIRHRRFCKLKKAVIGCFFFLALYLIVIFLVSLFVFNYIDLNNDLEYSKFMSPLFFTFIVLISNLIMNTATEWEDKKTEMFEICKYLDIHNNLTDQEKKFYDKQLD